MLIALLLAAAVYLSACQTITQGEVYDKRYIPAHDETYIDYDTIYVDGERHSFPQTKIRYCPDRYYIYIRKENGKGGFDKARYEVGEERYEQIHIGDEINFE